MLPLGNTSSLYGCNGEVKGAAAIAESYGYAIFLLFQLLLSVFGNSLVCVAIMRFSHLQTLTNSFIFSLGITDLLTPFVRVLFIAISMLRLEWVFGCFWCQLSSVLGVFLCSSSIMHLCAISVERFIVIRWPLQQHLLITKKRVSFVLVNIWLLSLLFSLFPFFGVVKMTFNVELLDCEIYWTESPEMAVLLACVFFLLPFLLMSITYYYIFLEVKIQSRKISAFQLTHHSSAKPRRKSTVMSRLRINRVLREELKAVKTIIVVIGLFFVLWVPFFAVTSVRAYRPESVSGPVQRLAFAMAYANSSCNWVVYSIMNKELRKAFKKMVPTLFRCNASQVEITSQPFPSNIHGVGPKSDAARNMTNKGPQSHGSNGTVNGVNKLSARTKREKSMTDGKTERTLKKKNLELNFSDLAENSNDLVD